MPDLAGLLDELADRVADRLRADFTADVWLDVKGAMAIVPGLTKGTVERWAREGRLRAVTAERGRLVFRRSWLDEALLAAPYTPRAAEQSDTADDDDLRGTGLRVVR